MSNVTSSYIGVSADDNLPTAGEIKAKSRDGIKNFLNERRAELDLEDEDINKLHDQRVKGDTFLALKYEMLVSPPLSIPVGPAVKLVELINKIQGEQPGAAGLLLTEEIASQIKFLYEHIKSETESTSLSTINGDTFQGFLNFSKLKIKHERFRGNYSGGGDIEPYKWSSHTESNRTQLMKIINYLNKYLKPALPDEIVIEDVANKKDFLKIRKNATIPFNINGGTDIILVEKQCVAGHVLKPGIRAIFELKKEVEERHTYQAILEMIIADCYVSDSVKVFGVLTDLRDIWNIFWLNVDKEIAMVNLTNRRKAFEAINQMVRSENPSIEGISNTKRMKYLDLFDKKAVSPYDDIAPMDDFEEDMDDNEVLMHQTKKVINALKYNPIFSSMLESPNNQSPPNNPTFPSMLESLPNSFSEF